MLESLTVSMADISSPWPRELQTLGEVSAKVESLAASIINLKDQSVKCDSRRQKNVEALAQIRKQKNGGSLGKADSVWTCGGPFFLKLSVDDAESFIRKDQEKLSETIDSLRKEQKKLLSELLALSPDKHMDPQSLKMLLKDV